MDHCPSELWTRIFGLACTDGGCTGRALARTSRYFRDAVLPVQLHSVALRGTSRMAAFADSLERRAPAHRRVRHLFLFGRVPRAMSKNNEIDGVLYRILSVVAPDLLTLASAMAHRPAARHNTLSFPRLTELTLNGYCLYHDTPSLRYLHIVFPSDESYTTHDSPSTHVRLPALSTLAPKLRLALLKLLVVSDESVSRDTDPDVGDFPLPATVQGISIHADNEHRLSRLFVGLLCADHEGQLRVEANVPYGVHYVQDEWEDRITGGYGCWGERAIRYSA